MSVRLELCRIPSKNMKFPCSTIARFSEIRQNLFNISEFRWKIRIIFVSHHIESPLYFAMPYIDHLSRSCNKPKWYFCLFWFEDYKVNVLKNIFLAMTAKIEHWRRPWLCSTRESLFSWNIIPKSEKVIPVSRASRGEEGYIPYLQNEKCLWTGHLPRRSLIKV